VTSRVYGCHRQLVLPAAPAVRRRESQVAARSCKVAALTGVLLVPVAGAAERPAGWAACTLAALGIALLTVLWNGAPWAWLTVLFAALGLVIPRGPWPVIGPVLFVATVQCLAVWLATRRPDDAHSRTQAKANEATATRRAQLIMGMSGERHVGLTLAHELPDEFVLIHGLKLPHGAGDVDHLVVGPTGVFLLETKTMAGHIECDERGNWRRVRRGRDGDMYTAFIGNPAAQVHRNIIAARRLLHDRLPNLFFGTPLWIEGLLVFPHPRTELAAERSRIAAVRLEDAAPWIRHHVPRRPLPPQEVDEIVDVLLAEGRATGFEVAPLAQSAQALVEAALAIPLVLVLLFGVVALSRIVHTETALITLAHESARAGALAGSSDEAVQRMQKRIEVLAPGLGLDARRVVLEWDVTAFGTDPGHVRAVVRYPIDVSDLPLSGWTTPPLVRAEHIEWVDPFRSGLVTGKERGP
jgi:hypothetical protein